jgi:hypothetical protein
MDIAERASCEALASESCRCRSTIAAADVECRPKVCWSSFSWYTMRHSKFDMFAPRNIYRKGFNVEEFQCTSIAIVVEVVLRIWIVRKVLKE